MVRTKDCSGAKTSNKATRKVYPSPMQLRSADKRKSGDKSGAGNSYCPRETPPWQKEITNFFAKNGEEDEGQSSSSAEIEVMDCDIQPSGSGDDVAQPEKLSASTEEKDAQVEKASTSSNENDAQLEIPSVTVENDIQPDKPSVFKDDQPEDSEDENNLQPDKPSPVKDDQPVLLGDVINGQTDKPTGVKDGQPIPAEDVINGHPDKISAVKDDQPVLSGDVINGEPDKPSESKINNDQQEKTPATDIDLPDKPSDEKDDQPEGSDKPKIDCMEVSNDNETENKS